MQTNLTHQAEMVLNALRRRLARLPQAAAPAVTDGAEARWRAQQLGHHERERALYQLRALGWPTA